MRALPAPTGFPADAQVAGAAPRLVGASPCTWPRGGCLQAGQGSARLTRLVGPKAWSPAVLLPTRGAEEAVRASEPRASERLVTAAL